ncbi:hypothetical protein [Novosphingobium sp. MMS21-SN21R]|uniref:hypothetical protein n=1 Tax=Novosphingobium sp. MMS21-SN21R TaxID=2969298 RepID=UPI0028855141|nr:hypothetical protein [Novosphingobium sp. MMS21-SN21R]MDT0506413.1 hypothetical protein [Novosphingobium sp. MMS21-SN21R]
MPCRNNTRKLGLWLAITVAITVASMSASKPHKVASVEPVSQLAGPRVSLMLPLN